MSARTISKGVVLAAFVLVVPFVALGPAGAHPLPDFPAGELWGRSTDIVTVYDVADVTNPQIKETFRSYRFPYGGGMAFDADRHLYLGVSHGVWDGLFIYDPELEPGDLGTGWPFEPIGFAPTEERPIVSGIAIRRPGQVIGCVRGWPGGLYAFDTTDVTHPVLTGVIEDVGFSGNICGVFAFDPDGNLWMGGWGGAPQAHP